MKQYLSVIIILSIPLFGITQTITKEKAKTPEVKLEVIIQDTAMLNEGSIVFNIYNDGINSAYNMNTESITEEIRANETKILIPLSSPINYGRISFTYKNQSKLGVTKPFSFSNNLFLFKEGDNIQLVITKNNVTFKGNGSSKYTCAYALSEHQGINHIQAKLKNSYLKNADYISYFKANQKFEDSLYNIKKAILDSYSSNIDVDAYNLMLADCWGEYNEKLISGIFIGTSSVADNFGSAHLNAVKNTYRQYISSFNGKFLPENILAKSLKYCDYLYTKEYFAKQAFSPRDNKVISSFLYRYNSIQKSYTGIIKDKVMLINFYRGKIAISDLKLVSDEAIKNTSDSIYKKAIVRIIKSLIGKAFPFELPDRYGKIHRLSDYNNRLIIIDFWYTGCINCIELAEKLKPIIKKFKANPDVVFISISIDGDKNRKVWLKSLENETYSSKDELNLLAQGKDAEIIKHYNIVGYPTLLVISKEGNVITLRPPDPRVNSEKFSNFLLNNL